MPFTRPIVGCTTSALAAVCDVSQQCSCIALSMHRKLAGEFVHDVNAIKIAGSCTEDT